MATDISKSILQSQRVQPRKANYATQGSNALQSIDQRPAHKKKHPIVKLPPPRVDRTQEKRKEKVNFDWIKRISLSPNALLVVLSGAAVAFFSFYVLFWSFDPIEIKPTHDDIMRRKLLEYAAANASVQLPTDDVIFNTSETFSWLNYTVKRGDSVSKIAADHSLSMDAIIASNNLSNARNLREGDIIRIPNMDGIPYTVVKGDTLKGIAEKFNVPLEAILDANDIQNDNISAGTVYFIPGAKMRAEDLRLAMGDLFVYPVHGRLTSPYGWRKDPFSGQRRYHRALDIAAPSGTAVKAAMAGKVTTVGTNEIFGNYVIITHSGGFQSMYAHLKSSSVVQGVGVKQGDIIGEVGSTGRSTGPHLHFAIYKNQRAVNPLDYLKI